MEVTDLTTMPAPANVSSSTPAKSTKQVHGTTPTGMTLPTSVLPASDSTLSPSVRKPSPSSFTGAGTPNPAATKSKKKRKTTGGMAPKAAKAGAGDDVDDVPYTFTPTPGYTANLVLMQARTKRLQRMMDAQCSELEKSVLACRKCSSLQQQVTRLEQQLDVQTKQVTRLEAKIGQLTGVAAAHEAEARLTSEALHTFERKMEVFKELKERLQQRSIDVAARERKAVETALRAEGQIRQREIQMQRRENQMLRSHMQSRERHMETMTGFLRCNMLGLVAPQAMLPLETSAYPSYPPAHVSEVPYTPPPSSPLFARAMHVPSTPPTVSAPHVSAPPSEGSFAAMDPTPTAGFMSPPGAASTANVKDLSFDELNAQL